MAGVTHSALRQILISFGGVGLLSTEMLSSRKLPTESPRFSPFLIRTAIEKPLSYQLLISADDEMDRAIDALHRLRADAIDLNMGCPAPSVGRSGAGIRLMERPGDVRVMVSKARRLTQLPLTAKIRIGIDLDEQKLVDFCRMLQDEGIDLLSVHARLKHESFARSPRWETIAAVKKRLSIPVIANGGIFTVDDARKCLELSEADGLMLGRGAVIRPWLFADIAREVFGKDLPRTEADLPRMYNDFIDKLVGLYRPEYRLGRLKEFTHYFAKNYQFGHHLASRVQSCESVEAARERAGEFFRTST